jgi:hypothetical protein
LVLFLDAENPEHKCFVCSKIIPDNKLSIDNVIPWSFMFSDDLWNLVYMHKSCNSSKYNVIPMEDEIAALEARNKRLLMHLKANAVLSIKKPVTELELAIDRDYVRKFWVNCRQ